MSDYRERAVSEMREARPAETVTPIMRKLVADAAVLAARGRPEAREEAGAARAYAIDHLDELHAELGRQLRARGIGYHRAADAGEAVATVRGLLRGANRVAKSKSMVAEEIGLTHALRKAGMDVLETDIGEYIVDIEGRGPSHITAPALHLNRARIREMLERTGANLPDDDPERLSRYVRDVVGAYFRECDAGITGVNMAVASSGRLALIENEGNVALGASHPKLHIAVTGLEKIVADERSALAVLEVLASNATAQPLTAFGHFLAEPAPGQERHVVFVDNGRSEIMRDERYREILKCIRCGACMNGCPVYRTAGGLSYGSPYMGPIGAVLSPLLWRDGRYADLPSASSLCGRCTEACPVGIPLHRMLLDLRADAVEAGTAGSWQQKIVWRGFATTFKHGSTGRLAERFANAAAGKLRRFARTGGTDPRRVSVSVERDPEMLIPLEERRDPVYVVTNEARPQEVVALLRAQLAANGVEVAGTYVAREGDRVITASGAIASTGSVVVCGENAARRALLGAGRVVVRLNAGDAVRFPSDAAGLLGDGDALILTGASRTADIEKQIVRGIHGAEDLVVVVTDGGSGTGPGSG
ncbi:MAG: LUD domain-containing protein [Tepidiformaceae bacterium]